MNHLGDLLQEEISGMLNGYVPSSDEVAEIFFWLVEISYSVVNVLMPSTNATLKID